MEVIYIRHGEAFSNTVGPEGLVGSDLGLTTEGIRQSDITAQTLAKLAIDGSIDPIPDVIYSSPYIRARETAGIIAKHLGRIVEIDYRLKEIQKGLWDNQTVGEVIKYEAAVAEADRHSFRPPEGENWFDVAGRMMEFVSEAEERGDKSLIVVSHNHPIEIAIGKMTGLDVTEWKDNPVDNASISRLFKDEDIWKIDKAIYNLKGWR